MIETEIKNFILEYEAEKQYARNRANDAEEEGDTFKQEMYEIIASGFSDLVYKLKSHGYVLLKQKSI